MNILPKKSWHVRKKENIARVRKDEAEAAEKEREIERRAKLAEQESRIALLRNRARERTGVKISLTNESITNSEPETKKEEADIYTSDGNINFFKDAEAGIATSGSSKEYEKEKKEEKETYEKKIGLLTYLGQDTLEATGKSPWYSDKKLSVTSISQTILENTEEDNEEIGLKSKIKVDPLNEILKHTDTKIYPKTDKIETPNVASSPVFHKSRNLCRKDKRHKKRKRTHGSDSDSDSMVKKKKRSHSSNSDSTIKKKKKKKHHKNKHRKMSMSCSAESENDEKSCDLAKLREERLKREAIERKREERLLAGKDPDVEEVKTKDPPPYKQKYSSQFNPHLAKQNQEPRGGLQAGIKYWLN